MSHFVFFHTLLIFCRLVSDSDWWFSHNAKRIKRGKCFCLQCNSAFLASLDSLIYCLLRTSVNDCWCNCLRSIAASLPHLGPIWPASVADSTAVWKTTAIPLDPVRLFGERQTNAAPLNQHIPILLEAVLPERGRHKAMAHFTAYCAWNKCLYNRLHPSN